LANSTIFAEKAIDYTAAPKYERTKKAKKNFLNIFFAPNVREQLSFLSVMSGPGFFIGLSTK